MVVYVKSGDRLGNGMIITRTPVRITFVGGGTDIKEYYSQHGGAVVNAAIDRYIYVILNRPFDDKIRVRYTENEVVDRVDDVRHPLMREALRYLGISGGIDVVSIADIPTNIAGNGLGSSSAFLVGMLNALHAWKGERVAKDRLAEEAFEIERNILGQAGGKQDQYIAAYGGMHMWEFMRDGRVVSNPVELDDRNAEELRSHILLLFLGKEHSSTSIHDGQRGGIGDKVSSYTEMKSYAYEMYRDISNGMLDRVGRLLDMNWRLKRTLDSGITSDDIDRIYKIGMDNGASGGKLIGAGGGGFMMFYADPSTHKSIIGALPELRPLKFDFDRLGSTLLSVRD